MDGMVRVALEPTEEGRATPGTPAPPPELAVGDAFDALVRDHRARIVRTVALVVGDVGVAEEVAQDAFARAFASWRRVGGYDAPDAWVRRVAIRDAVRRSGRDRRRPEREALAGTRDAGTGRGAAASDPAGGVADHLDVVAAVRDLPPQQRAAVVLHYLDDLPVAAVADALGCSASTAKVHLHRARRTLAARLGEEPDDDPR